MNDGRWRITVEAPDWGQDHLCSDAIVAFVDDELAHRPHQRATQHVAQCRECASQVIAQRQARSALRTAGGPSLPSSLLTSLRSIPQNAELPAPPPGLAVTGDGTLVALASPERAAPASDPERGAPSARGVRPQPSSVSDHGRRRIRLGTGVAVSGLALGALAFGAPTGDTASPVPPSAERGVLGGPVLGGTGAGPSGVLEARLQLAPTGPRPPVAETFLGPALGGR